MKDIKAGILDNRRIGPSVFKMILDAPYIAKEAKPGQFVQVRCSGSLGPLLRRPFSVHRLKASLDVARDRQGSKLKGIEILYEVVGRGTELLSEKKKGEFLDVLGPLGTGFTLPLASSLEPRAILVAGGMGVAPLVFLAEKLKRRRIKAIVFIGARTKKSLLCEKDFKKLGAELHIASDDGTCGYKGFVSGLLKRYLQNNLGFRSGKAQYTIYACGPQPMLRCIAQISGEFNIECQISMEERMACGFGVCLGCAVKIKDSETKEEFVYKLACKDGPVFDSGRIIWE